jgi:hypothetical protein
MVPGGTRVVLGGFNHLQSRNHCQRVNDLSMVYNADSKGCPISAHARFNPI